MNKDKPFDLTDKNAEIDEKAEVVKAFTAGEVDEIAHRIEKRNKDKRPIELFLSYAGLWNLNLWYDEEDDTIKGNTAIVNYEEVKKWDIRYRFFKAGMKSYADQQDKRIKELEYQLKGFQEQYNSNKKRIKEFEAKQEKGKNIITNLVNWYLHIKHFAESHEKIHPAGIDYSLDTITKAEEFLSSFNKEQREQS